MFTKKSRIFKHRGHFGVLALSILLLILAACSSAERKAAAPDPADTPVPAVETVKEQPEIDEQTMEAEIIPSVTVIDQAIAGNAVTIAKVVSDGPGWLVIHAQADGAPGPVLGYSTLESGRNETVAVEIDLAGATETLYAMLHTDGGEIGAWELQGGPDTPVTADVQVITPAFRLLAAEGSLEIAMANRKFDPPVAIIKAGTELAWVNMDQARHNVHADSDAFRSELFGQDGSFSLRIAEPGVYPYYCDPHGGPEGEGMAGTIIVLPSI